jgi:hypothetical protein
LGLGILFPKAQHNITIGKQIPETDYFNKKKNASSYECKDRKRTVAVTNTEWL